jgi:hypothetical protein
MPFNAQLTVDDKTYPIRAYYMIVSRDVDPKGRPNAKFSWQMAIRIDAMDDTTLTNWMVDPSKQLDGKITLYKIDQMSKQKEIQFKQSYCYRMDDLFIADTLYSNCQVVISGTEDLKVEISS